MDFDINIEEIWKDYGLGELEEGLKTLFPEYSVSLEGLLQKVLSGDILGAGTDLLESVMKGLGSQFTGLKNILVWLLVLGIISALMSYFAGIFDRYQIADLSFYVMYLLMTVVLLKCFEQVAQTAVDVMENVVLFMKMLVPAYMLSVGIATGTTTVSAYYQLLLLLIYGVENILVSGVVGLVYSYCVLAIVNGIWIEEKLTMLLELLAKGIGVLLKAAVGVVTGISIFQSVITPVIDSVKSSALQKAISAIPGIGNAADGVVELVTGSAVIIKNSLGIVLLLLLLALCVSPLLQILLMAFLLKAAAAMMGIVSDKRLTTCTDRVGEGIMMLFRTAGTAMLLFLVTISVVTMSTNRGF